MFVVGTAGHVDHGKSTLIKALTGIDPDRLKEEKERQMTIELGFAWMELPSGQEIGFVDVPGHRDFVENMLVGMGGIDFALLIVAADEGVMPQTREHLSILDLYGIEEGIIVLTKIDKVNDPEWLDLVRSDLCNLLKNTRLANSATIEVSAFENSGLDELISTIDKKIDQMQPKKDYSRPRLPIDRKFTMKGFGTIVTGTLINGTLKKGDLVEILPTGISTRIRELQTHKRMTDCAEPGTRTALNLVNVDTDQIERGDVVAFPGIYQTTRRFDCFLRVLPNISRNLEHNEEVKIFTGTDQVLGRIRCIGNKMIPIGDSGYVQIETDELLPLFREDKFILRRPSPAETIAGGEVLDISPNGRYRINDQTISKYLEDLHRGNKGDIPMILIDHFEFISFKELTSKTGYNDSELQKYLGSEINSNKVKVLDFEKGKLTPNCILISGKKWKETRRFIIDELRNYHAKNPISNGKLISDLNKAKGMPDGIWTKVLTALHFEGNIQIENQRVKLPGFSIDFSDAEKENISKINQLLKENPYSPPSLRDMEKQFDGRLLEALIASGELINSSEDIVFSKTHFDKMVSETKHLINQNGSVTLAQVRDHFGTSRKYAASFLEYLDSRNITIRKGDFRVLKNIDN